jgi:tRNA threonylcarbamoyl adenosine modification protein YeaZ
MSRLVLAFDTATDRCALGLGRWTEEGVETRVTADFEAPRAALGRLLPAVRDLLVAEGLAPGDLCEVVVGRGPGSFTGVRIGVATAKGLAHGLGTPLFGTGTLDAIAWACAGRFSGVLGVVGDAMRGEVYPALFTLADGKARRLTEDRVAHPSDVVAEWSGRGSLCFSPEVACASMLRPSTCFRRQVPWCFRRICGFRVAQDSSPHTARLVPPARRRRTAADAAAAVHETLGRRGERAAACGQGC